MKHWRLSLSDLIAALVCAATAVSAHAGEKDRAPTVLAATTLEFADAARQRSLTSELWYSAQAGVEPAAFRALAPFVSMPIARGAAPSPALTKRPLIVMSHGNWGTRYAQGWLARSLVDAGYVVMSVSHPGTMNGDITVAGRARLWDRARDVSTALTQLLAQPQWQALIDERRIAFVGHSFGGFAGVGLAGGTWDSAAQQVACEQQRPKDLYCDGFAETQDPSISREGMAGSFHDARFKAFYLMAAGPSAGFSRTSLANIRAPFFVDTASLDDVLEPAGNSIALVKAIPGARGVERPVGHFTYVPECRPLIGKVIAALVCSDPPGVDRKAAHREIGTEVVKFFNAVL